FGLGIDTAVHYYDDLRRRVEGHGPLADLEARFVESYRQTAGAVVTASLTTALVFFVFAFSRLPALSELGLLAGLGLIANLAGIHLVFPAVLALWLRRGRSLSRRPPETALLALGNWVGRHRRPILVLAALAT